MAAVFLGCLLVAALSLLLPSAPSFDPWAWIVWGRETSQLALDTTGGPSWKPLPVVFTTLFAPFAAIDGDLPAGLWLVVARTGALLSLVLVFRLTRRLAGAGWHGVAAGVVAAAALALLPQWLRYAAHGNEVPMAVALMLWAIERHLDGHRGHALTAAFLACLMRPEVFPLLAPYGLWLWLAEPRHRRLAVGLAVALPTLWLVPDWLASGNPLGAPSKASSEPPWSLSLRERPWLAALARADRVAGPMLEVGAVTGAAFAVVCRDGRMLALAGCALAWIGLIATMTELGFSGSTRYFAPAMVAACVLTGVAVVRVIALAERYGAAAMGATAVAILLAASPAIDARVDRFGRQWQTSSAMAALQDDLAGALREAGGKEPVVAAGAPSINRGLLPHLAWETGLTLAEMEHAVGDGFVFSTPGHPLWGQPPLRLRQARARTFQMRVGRWEIAGPVAPRAGRSTRSPLSSIVGSGGLVPRDP